MTWQPQLKHDWVLKVDQPTHIYNNDRLHTSNNDMSPVSYELSEMFEDEIAMRTSG